MKNENLYSYHLEIQGWKGSIMAEFNKGKIKNFYEKNSVRLNLLLERLDKLQVKYFEIDEKNKIVMMPDDPTKPKMKEGMLFEDYEKDHNELMNRDIEIIF